MLTVGTSLFFLKGNKNSTRSEDSRNPKGANPVVSNGRKTAEVAVVLMTTGEGHTKLGQVIPKAMNPHGPGSVRMEERVSVLVSAKR